MDRNSPAVLGPVEPTVMQHTRGPWHFYTEPQPNGCPIVGARGLMVCMLAHTVNQPEQRGEALANAALIAAAPDLLNALQALQLAREQNKYPSWEKGVPKFNEAEALADAAIARAVGRAA